MALKSKVLPFEAWSTLEWKLPGRLGKQARDRWVNHLNPAINREPFSRADDLLLWEAHCKLGNKWTKISIQYFVGTRSENQLKNRFYSEAFKKVIVKDIGLDAYENGHEGKQQHDPENAQRNEAGAER